MNLPTTIYLRVLCLGLLLLASACGTTPTEPTAEEAPAATEEAPAAAEGPDVAWGEALFQAPLIANQTNGCSNCHSVDASQWAIAGPNLAGIATQAATRVEGQSAEAYLRTSIVDPAAYEVEDWSAGGKPANYGELLSDDELDSLVLYLMTLE